MKIIDDNNSRSIDLQEFKKACKDFRFDLNDREINLIFKAFDSGNGDGAIDYEEFLTKIRVRAKIFYKYILESDELFPIKFSESSI